MQADVNYLPAKAKSLADTLLFYLLSIDLALTPQLTEVDPPEKNGIIKIKK